MVRSLLGTWLAVAALALILTAPAPAADVGDITGKYTCQGTNPAGATYTGTVEIVKKEDTYYLTWKLGAGDTYAGLGILEGDVLAVSWYGNATGIVVYKVEKGGKLVGKWTLPEAKGKVFTETLTK